MYPLIEIDLKKVEENAKKITTLFRSMGIDIMAVTKGFSADEKIVTALTRGNVEYLADSRLMNLKKMKGFPLKKVLLRLPMASEVNELVRYADYSMNSELSTLKEIGRASWRNRTVHKVIVMIDLGDHREGIQPKNLDQFVAEAVKIKGVEIRGFGVNMTCFSGVIPEQQTLIKLVKLTREMEEKYQLNIEMISGGSSSSVYLINEGGIPEGISNLRLGEVILLGTETAYGKNFINLHEDIFTLRTQIIEIKDKPSMPKGLMGKDAFGHEPVHEDRGILRRAIVALGRQDADPDGVIPSNSKIKILGASSDHMIVDITDDPEHYEVGDIMSFKLKYSGLLRAMTSPYVEKVYLNEEVNLGILPLVSDL